MPKPIKPTKPPRPALSRATIVAAARRIADQEGLDAVTSRRVAAEFDTGQSSLYRHIAGRDELLGLLADDLVAGYPLLADDSGEPVAVLLRQWQALHDHLAARPWAAPLIAEGAHLAHHSDAAATILMGQLERTGLGADHAARAYRALWQLLLGHLLNGHPFGHADSGGRPDLNARDDSPGMSGSDEFGWALSRLVAGIRSGEAPQPGAAAVSLPPDEGN